MFRREVYKLDRELIALIEWWRRAGIEAGFEASSTGLIFMIEGARVFHCFKDKEAMLASPRGRLFFLCTSSATSCSARSASVVSSCSRSYPSFGSAAASFQRARPSSSSTSSSSSSSHRRQNALASFSTSAPSSSSASNVTDAKAAAMGVGKTESSGLRTMVWFRKVSFFSLPLFFPTPCRFKKKKLDLNLLLHSLSPLPPCLSPSRACASTTTRP